MQYKKFKKNHAGGDHYDLTKWSKKDREEYTLGSKAYSRRIEMDSDSDSGSGSDSE
jgi:hypothetical protein